MIRRLARSLPRPVKAALRNALWGAQDLWGDISGKDGLMPPRRMIFIGDGDFKKTGEAFAKILKDHGLESGDRVLDVGSGIGRMAIPLTPYLAGTGSYDGLEIVRSGVDWCRENVTPKFPRFRFHWADVYNFEYNPEGKLPASSYRFPFPDAGFDFIFLTSVFTHMMPEDLENYVSELARVAAPGATLLVTFFLLNPESRDLVRRGASTQDFKHEGKGYMTIDPKMPEAAVAFPEEYVLGLLQSRGFEVKAVRHGSWCGRKDFFSYQDIIVAERKPR